MLLRPTCLWLAVICCAWPSLSAFNITVVDDAVTVKQCYVDDLRRIREFLSQPVRVFVNHCFLQDLPNAVFIRFSQLQYLEICDSRLNHLQDYALNGLHGLTSLNLAKNNLTFIKTWSDHELESLHTLDLRRNLITDIDRFALRRYPNLTKLNLAVNSISRLEEATFKFTPHLKYLNIGKNNLTSIDEQTFKGLNKLSTLSLHHNHIRYIDFFAFASNTHLKSLQLQENEISVFEADLIAYMPRLIFLNISHNQLEALNEETFDKNKELKVLDISYNRLAALPENTLHGLTVLEVFNASHNTIHTINKYMFADCSSMKYFDLSNNNLTFIADNLFEYASQIKHLNLSHNQVEDIDRTAFEGLPKLRNLDLAANRLASDSFLWPIVGLTHLNLSHNAFRNLNTSLMDQLEVIELAGNPWDCKWLMAELMVTPKRLNFGREYLVEAKHEVHNVPGVACWDEGDVQKFIIVINRAAQAVDEDETFQQKTATNTMNRNNKASIVASHLEYASSDSFDYKITLLWLTIGVAVVFGAATAMRVLLKKSEKKSEDLRLEQQVSRKQKMRPRRPSMYRPYLFVNPDTNYETITSITSMINNHRHNNLKQYQYSAYNTVS